MIGVLRKFGQPLMRTETNKPITKKPENQPDSVEMANCRFVKRMLAVLAGLMMLVGYSDTGLFPPCCLISLATFGLRYLPVFRPNTQPFTFILTSNQGGCNYGNDG